MKKITLLTISFLLAMAVIVSNGFSWPQGKNKNCPNQGGHMHQGGPMHKNCGQNQGSHPGIGQGYHGQGHMHNGWGQKLSQDQKDQLKALHQQFIDENVETRTTIANLYNEMRMEMKTSPKRSLQILFLDSSWGGDMGVDPMGTKEGFARIGRKMPQDP